MHAKLNKELCLSYSELIAEELSTTQDLINTFDIFISEVNDYHKAYYDLIALRSSHSTPKIIFHLKHLDLVKEIAEQISNLSINTNITSVLPDPLILEILLEDLVSIKIALTIYPILYLGSTTSINSSIDACNNLVVSKINSLR